MQTRIPTCHTVTPQPKYEVIRRNFSPFFLPPVKGMREPGTNYMSILTNEGHILVDYGQ